jgi:NAD(P)-dependent dehydrogenase (short-subunit alcohol dehydrogenase family)
MIDLAGKHIFIAGGSRGIGRANALMAARAGADITVNYLKDAAAANAVVDEIKRMNRKAFAVQADIAKDGEAERAMNAAFEQLGPIRGLAISAGIFEGAPIEQMSAEFWDRTMSINLRSTFLAVRAAVPYLKRAKGGSIVIYTSTAGQRGSSVYSAYATSKGAQLMFMRSMAKELAPERIRVNCVAPGWTDTDMSREAMNAEGRDGIIASIPLGRIGKPEDPAAAACFLLSDLAQFITGSTITVDGGFDMRG